jgi:hypothetical protein
MKGHDGTSDNIVDTGAESAASDDGRRRIFWFEKDVLARPRLFKTAWLYPFVETIIESGQRDVTKHFVIFINKIEDFVPYYPAELNRRRPRGLAKRPYLKACFGSHNFLNNSIRLGCLF